MIAIVAFMAPTASQVLADVQAHYATVTDLTLDFEQKVTNITFGATKTSEGTLFLQKPNRFRLDYVKRGKLDKEFIYDGSTLWIVEHQNLSILKNTAPNAALPAVGSFLTNGNLAATYDVALSGNTLALTPKQPDTALTKLELVVDLTTSEVTASIVTDPSGNTNDFAFKSSKAAKISATRFVFSPSSQPGYKLTNISPPTSAHGSSGTPAPPPTPMPTPAPAPTPAKHTP